jgi:hypothetical protein
MGEVCLICLARLGSDLGLASHVVILHTPYKGLQGYTCWCGYRAVWDVGDLWDHCEERGGYLAHYLECQLGLEH